MFHPGISAGDYNIEDKQKRNNCKPLHSCIQDQNIADLMGDALFICMDCLQKQKSFIDHNYTLLLGPAESHAMPHQGLFGCKIDKGCCLHPYQFEFHA